MINQTLDGQRFLVTGGAGVVAREVLAQLSTAGAEVISVDRLPLPTSPLAGVEHVIGDLSDMDLGTLARFRPQHVLHLAATFERSVESPGFWAQNWNDNVVATHRLAELGNRLAGLESFVFASSYLVYDPNLYLFSAPPSGPVKLSEGARLRPRNLCGAAKLYGEAEVFFAQNASRASFRTVFARIFRVYGRGSRDIISRWIRASIAGERIEVYHPENRFDYVFSGEVAEGLIRMATTPGASGPINLALGASRTVGDVVSAIEIATGRPFDRSELPVAEPYEASEADLQELEARVRWRPSTTLEAGVARLVEHEEQRDA